MEWAEDLFTLKKSAKKGRRAAQAAAAAAAAAASNSSSTISATIAADSSATNTTRIPSPTMSSGSPPRIIPLINREKPPRISKLNQASSSSRSNSIDDDLPSNLDILGGNNKHQNDDRPKKIGGWADEPIKATVGRGGAKSLTTNLIEQERFSTKISGNNNGGNLSDDDIPIIPDLDDLQDEQLMNEMAEAPEVSVNRVATYKELNSDLLKQGVFAALEDIDLSQLARCIQPESALNEPDEIWRWDQLFTEISADLHAEKPKSAEPQSIHRTQFVN